MQRSVLLIISVIVSLGIALSGFFVGKGISNIHKFDQYVSVKGLAEKEVKANKVIWQISYTVHGNSIKSLYSQLTHDQNAINEFLSLGKIPKESIQFGSTSVNMNTNSPTVASNDKKVAYTGYSDITVVTDKVELVQQLSQKTSQLIANDILINASNLKYQYTKLNEIKPELLKLATTNAKISANNFAKQSQASVGKIRQAAQGLFSIKNADDSYGDQDSNKIIRVVVNIQYAIN